MKLSRSYDNVNAIELTIDHLTTLYYSLSTSQTRAVWFLERGGMREGGMREGGMEGGREGGRGGRECGRGR